MGKGGCGRGWAGPGVGGAWCGSGRGLVWEWAGPGVGKGGAGCGQGWVCISVPLYITPPTPSTVLSTRKLTKAQCNKNQQKLPSINRIQKKV